MKLKAIFACLALTIVLAFGYITYFQPTKKTPPIINQEPPKIEVVRQNEVQTTKTAPTKIPASDKDTTTWKNYKDSKYKFEFQYPSNSEVELRQDINYQYIRLQNYISSDSPSSLADGEYYLEIFIYDPRMGHAPPQTCAQSVINPKKINLRGVIGYRGLGETGGDAGGTRFALCVERQDVYLYAQGTENSEEALLINKIFDSFKFSN